MVEYVLSAAFLSVIWHCINQGDNLPKKMEKLFKVQGFVAKDKETGEVYKPRLKTWKRTEDYTRMVYYLPEGFSINDFEKRLPWLKHVLGGHIELSCKHQFLVIECWTKELPKKMKFTEYPEPPEKMLVPIPLGLSAKGFEWFDITDSPHLLIGGLTGFGKSSYLNYLITYLLLHQNVEMFFFDFKLGGVEARKFLGSSTNIATTIPEAIKLMQKIEGLLKQRVKTIIKANVSNWKDLICKPPYILLVIDEYASMAPGIEGEKGLKKLKQHLESYVNTLASQARSCGFSLAVCTQNPYAEILKGMIKNNLAATLAFKARNEISSNILLSNDLASELDPYPGRAIFQFHNPVELQVPYMSDHTVRTLLSIGQTIQNYTEDSMEFSIDESICSGKNDIGPQRLVVKHPY